MLRSSFALFAATAVVAAQDGISSELAPQRDFIARYCFDCHGADLTKAQLDLSTDLSTSTDAAVARLFRLDKLRARVRVAEMPPPDADQPTAAERQAFVTFVDDTLWRQVPELPPAPGRITVRRLNASQWQRSVQDLFGVTVSTAGFPADDLGYGFDTVGDAMSFSTLHLEKYLAAAGAVADLVFTGEDPDHPAERRFEAEAMRVVEGPGVGLDGDYANLYTRALLEQVVRLPRDGVYRLKVSARSTAAGDEPAKLVVRWDDRDLETFEVPGARFKAFELTAPFAGGEHRLGLGFTNDFYDPENPDPKRRDRNLHIDRCDLVGPIDPRVVPPQQQWLHAALPRRGVDEARFDAVVQALLPRIFRRPVAAAEIERYVGVGEAAVQAGDDFDGALRLVLQAALTSPNFLFRGETGDTPGDAGGAVPVASVALASRLSYFLWASVPDARLDELGRRGALADREVLLAEARRLLADPRADSLATEFAAQWLELDNLGDRTPDPERFPGFDDGLRRSLRGETERLFAAVLREDRDVRELIDCDFTFVDARLAEFYGLPWPDGAEGHVRVALPAELRRRGGVLGHASILAVTSNPTRTSPVKRGKWILENLLGAPPPPPPPGNDSLPDEQAIDSSKSFREQLAQHRADSKCAVCHIRMDALGLALERFDAIGRYRERDAGGVIDCSGELPDGRVVDGLVDLKAVLRADPAFVQTVARKLFVYGIGRDPRPVDRLVLDRAIAELLRGDKVTIGDLLLAIVGSDAFRLRRVEAVR